MKFRKVLTSIASLKGGKYFDFNLTEAELKEAKNRKFDNPLLIYQKGDILAVYLSEKGKLKLSYYVSHWGFEEGFGEHNPTKFENTISCSCGEKFPSGKRVNAEERFKKHLEEIERLKNEEKVAQ